MLRFYRYYFDQSNFLENNVSPLNAVYELMHMRVEHILINNFVIEIGYTNY